MPVGIAPDRLAEIQAEFARGWHTLCAQAQQGGLEPPRDRRFSNPAWASDPRHAFMAHAWTLSSKALSDMVEAAQLPEAARNRLRFAVMQWAEASSPSNFIATNPEAQQALLETGGQSLLRGLGNLMQDMQRGRLTQSDESGFQLGVSLATTEGHVIFQNELIQLIQYTPRNARTYRTPLLIVPPCINKYYILDLQPANSFVRHALEQGFSVMLISWRNPLPSDGDGIDAATWRDYLCDGVLEAVRVAREVSGQPQINALGFCVGGTLLASALALALARGDDPVRALTLLTTLLDFSDTGVLGVFVDEAHAQAREQQLGAGGLMSARELGTTFSFLRPAELVWNYVAGNYLKGNTPPAFDLLYWNADGTNLPGPFFAWYFRNTYLENNLKIPGRIKVDGHPLDLGRLRMPVYLYGSRDDHIVPWRSAYASSQLLRGETRFVLGASGHIAGVINPPDKGRRSHWVHDACDDGLPGDPDLWMAGAQERPGSWWPDWSAWLAGHSGAMVRASRKPGGAGYKAIEPAPGRYAATRAT